MRLLWKALAVSGVGLVLTGSSAPSPLPASTPGALNAICGPTATGGALLRELLIASAVAAPASQARPIPLYPDLTTSPFRATTDDPRARAYFSQGLMFAYGFNHAGAVRSFREAQGRDPDCAACWWGEALSLGPNINAPMDNRDRAAALSASDRAMALREKASAARSAAGSRE